MKKLLLICCLVLSAPIGFGQQIMKMNIIDLENYIMSRPHPSVINFWATWCSPCLEEMPWFNEAIKNFKDKKVELILVSLDNKKAFPEQIIAILKERNIKATFIWLNESNADYFCPKIDSAWSGSIPASLFVNHIKGRRKFFEQQVSAAELNKQLRLLTE